MWKRGYLLATWLTTSQSTQAKNNPFSRLVPHFPEEELERLTRRMDQLHSILVTDDDEEETTQQPLLHDITFTDDEINALVKDSKNNNKNGDEEDLFLRFTERGIFAYVSIPVFVNGHCRFISGLFSLLWDGPFYLSDNSDIATTVVSIEFQLLRHWSDALHQNAKIKLVFNFTESTSHYFHNQSNRQIPDALITAGDLRLWKRQFFHYTLSDLTVLPSLLAKVMVALFDYEKVGDVILGISISNGRISFLAPTWTRKVTIETAASSSRSSSTNSSALRGSDPKMPFLMARPRPLARNA